MMTSCSIERAALSNGARRGRAAARMAPSRRRKGGEAGMRRPAANRDLKTGLATRGLDPVAL